MFTWLNKQGVKSDEGYILQRMHRFYYHYIEGDRHMQVNIEPCFDKQNKHSITIYTNSLIRWLPLMPYNSCKQKSGVRYLHGVEPVGMGVPTNGGLTPWVEYHRVIG